MTRQKEALKKQFKIEYNNLIFAMKNFGLNSREANKCRKALQLIKDEWNENEY